MNPSQRIDQLIAHLFQQSHLADPKQALQRGPASNKWRAIDFFEVDKLHERGLKDLVRAAIDYNQSKLKRTQRVVERSNTEVRSDEATAFSH